MNPVRGLSPTIDRGAAELPGPGLKTATLIHHRRTLQAIRGARGAVCPDPGWLPVDTFRRTRCGMRVRRPSLS
jgi:hypothetical protein